MTAKQVASLAKSGEPTRKSDGKGLYFVVPDSGAPYWALRYSGNGKRKQMTLGQYPDMSLAKFTMPLQKQAGSAKKYQNTILSKR
ncbi:Arm DNA-binding domain-containing protein [Shewanella algae]|nr:Arm DNA-binding domain-containing protein [Shewanella algae]